MNLIHLTVSLLNFSNCSPLPLRDWFILANNYPIIRSPAVTEGTVDMDWERPAERRTGISDPNYRCDDPYNARSIEMPPHGNVQRKEPVDKGALDRNAHDSRQWLAYDNEGSDSSWGNDYNSRNNGNNVPYWVDDSKQGFQATPPLNNVTPNTDLRRQSNPPYNPNTNQMHISRPDAVVTGMVDNTPHQRYCESSIHHDCWSNLDLLFSEEGSTICHLPNRRTITDSRLTTTRMKSISVF